MCFPDKGTDSRGEVLGERGEHLEGVQEEWLIPLNPTGGSAGAI